MLREVLRYLLTPCSREARSLGYLYEAVALQARAARQKAHWSGHIENCHKIISQAVLACAGFKSALVCGSGLLLEAPMEALLARFGRVDCLDIVHPRGVGKRYPPDRVRFIEADITGMIQPIAAAVRAKKPFDAAQPPPVPAFGREYDLVISCNLASQLALLPLKNLAGLHVYERSQLDAFGRALVATHLRWLAALPGVACLITDTDREYRRLGGEPEFETEDALFGLGLAKATAAWWWDIAPAPELERNLSQRNRVAGIAVFGADNIVFGESGEEPLAAKDPS
jgi:hypothetical protein